MSKKKKVVSTTKTKKKKKLSPTVSKAKVSSTPAAEMSIPEDQFIFGKQNYILMAVGVGLVLLGMLLMSGGGMPNDEVWDENIIYGFRRTVLAPFVILLGLIVEIYAIFKK